MQFGKWKPRKTSCGIVGKSKEKSLIGLDWNMGCEDDTFPLHTWWQSGQMV